MHSRVEDYLRQMVFSKVIGAEIVVWIVTSGFSATSACDGNRKLEGGFSFQRNGFRWA
jgi:hypothetical protein